MSFLFKNISFVKPNEEDFSVVKQYIKEFKLDDQELSIDQFVIAKQDESLLGFARIKDYSNFVELSSVGVLNDKRNLGIGKALIKYLLALVYPADVYIATVIPQYFKKLGFEITESFPSPLGKKLDFCQVRYHGANDAVKVMKYNII